MEGGEWRMESGGGERYTVGTKEWGLRGFASGWLLMYNNSGAQCQHPGQFFH
jgi:hypothetical protein